MKRILVILALLVTMFTAVSATADQSILEETPDLSITKTLEETDVNHQYNITFNLPSKTEREVEEIDSVFYINCCLCFSSKPN